MDKRIHILNSARDYLGNRLVDYMNEYRSVMRSNVGYICNN